MASIRFYPKLERNTFITVMCCISHQQHEKHKSIGYQLPGNKVKDDFKYWDKKNKCARGHDTATDINARISGWMARFNEYKGRVKRYEIEFNFEDAFAYISEGKAKQKANKLADIFEMYIAAQKGSVSAGNIIHYRTVQTDLKAYEQAIRHSHSLSEVTKEFYKNFGVWLSTDKDEEDQGNVNNTINRKIGRIVTVMGWAFEEGFIDNQRYKLRFSFKGHDSTRFPLNEQEIEALAEFESDEALERCVVDAFIFACYTGLRFKDIMQLRQEHIKSHQDADGLIKYIDFTQTKGTKDNMIPLSTKALLILQRQPDTNSYFFAGISNQVGNRILKRAANEMGLHRKIEMVTIKGTETIKEMVPLNSIISWHFARNTYISLLLASGVNPIFVQGNVGHSDLKTTMIYSKQNDITRWKETLKAQNK